MKKMVGLVFGVLLIFTLVACTNTEEKEEVIDKQEVVNKEEVAVIDIMRDIEGKIVQDVTDAGFDDGRTDEEILQSYMKTDLVNVSTDNPFGQMFYERTKLDKTLLAEGLMLVPMFNTNADEIFILKAKNEQDAKSLKIAMEKELEAQIQTWEQYLPDQYEKVKNNVLKTNGKYVLYVTYSDPDAVEKLFDEKIN